MNSFDYYDQGGFTTWPWQNLSTRAPLIRSRITTSFSSELRLQKKIGAVKKTGERKRFSFNIHDHLYQKLFHNDAECGRSENSHLCSMNYHPDQLSITLQKMRTSESVTGVERTLLLVGKTGNGKSATGNSILGRKVFDSMRSLTGVTTGCNLQTTILDDGMILNVIDTPGLFDPNIDPHDIAKEIATCIDLAKDGIHAALIVLSIGNRLSPEEMAVFEGLRQIFGNKINDYMIVVFSHGDLLDDESLDSFFCAAPENLKMTLNKCGDRRVVFDNRTRDEVSILQQRGKLLNLVNDVVVSNGGTPYTNDLFDELKNGDSRSHSEGDTSSSQGGQFEQFTEKVESRLTESISRLEKQVEEQRAARQQIELRAQEVEIKSKKEIQDLSASLLNCRLKEKEKMTKAELKSKIKTNDLQKRLIEAENRRQELNRQLHHRPGFVNPRPPVDCVIL